MGYVPLYRKIKEWEWYTEANTMRLFIHCLVSANHKKNKWRGVTVEKGSFITSVANLANDLNLSNQNIRTALNNLKSTNEITINSTNKYTMINVVNWSLYALGDDEANKQTNKQNNIPLTNNQQTTNKQLTTNNNEKNLENEENVKKKDIVGQPDAVPYKEIIEYLNAKTEKSFSASGKTNKEVIKARWNNGFRLEDFKYVIDVKSREWLNTEQDKYLRPTTLFGNKFEAYRNQKLDYKNNNKPQDIKEWQRHQKGGPGHYI